MLDNTLRAGKFQVSTPQLHLGRALLKLPTPWPLPYTECSVKASLLCERCIGCTCSPQVELSRHVSIHLLHLCKKGMSAMCSVNRASSVRPKDEEKLVQGREGEEDESGAQRQQHRRPSGNRAASQPSSRILQIRRRGAWKQCATDGQNDASRYATKPDHLHQQSQ